MPTDTDLEALQRRAITAAVRAVAKTGTTITADQAETVLNAADRVYQAAEKRLVKKRADEAQILGWNIDGDGMDLRISHAMGTTLALVEAAKTFLDANPGAKNYIEQDVIDRKTGDHYTVTFQKPRGRTPHQLRREAEDRYARLRSAVNDFADTMESLGGDGHNGHGQTDGEPECPGCVVDAIRNILADNPEMP